MKTKFLLPVLAMIFAVGMSFTTVNSSLENYAIKYVHDGNMWHAIEVECGQDVFDCKVVFTQDPTLKQYQVYNTQNLNDRALGTSGIKPISGPAPSN